MPGADIKKDLAKIQEMSAQQNANKNSGTVHNGSISHRC